MKTMLGLALAVGLTLVATQSPANAHDIGPNKMPIAEWGDEEYHLEIVPDAKAGTVTVYVYGNHDDLDKAKRKAIDTKSLVVAFKNPALVVKAVPAPEKDDPAGKASKFVAKSDKLSTLGKITGTVSGKIGTKPYTGDFKQK